MSADDLIAVLWHQAELKDFDKIARLTRYQIAHILCRHMDDKGHIDIHGEPDVSRKRGDAPAVVILTTYEDIFRHSQRLILEQQRYPAEKIEAEVEQRWQEAGRPLSEGTTHASTPTSK